MHPPHYLPRAVHPLLEARLSAFPVVVITGARQTGKSTLARAVGGAERTYLTLDDLSVLDQATRAPDQLVSRGSPITLDEVQRAPELLLAVKRAVDEDRVPGRFLLTGSTNLELQQGISETLAGRAIYLTLWPMTAGEAAGAGRTGPWSTFLDEAPGDWLEALTPAVKGNRGAWREVAARGGYPDPALRMRTADDRAAWFEGYLRTYVERDLQQLAAIDNLVGFQRLVRAAALRIGSVLNRADLARDVGLPPTTAQRYLDLLETSYQLIPLPAYSVNRTKRLVKSPKLYWSDTGFAAHLAAADELRGAHLENLILHDLLVWRELRAHRPQLLYWRTSKGAEVDFVIEAPERLLPVEVKTASNLRVRDARHLTTFLDEYSDTASHGVVLYDGDEAYWLTDRVIAVPVGWVVEGGSQTPSSSTASSRA